jgi:hypothetical protein
MTELTEPPLLVLACGEGIPSNLRAVNRSARRNCFSAEGLSLAKIRYFIFLLNINMLSVIFIYKMRSIKHIFITISAILVLYTSLNAEENSDFSLGKKSLQDGFYEIAAKSFEKFLSEKPGDADTLNARLRAS